MMSITLDKLNLLVGGKDEKYSIVCSLLLVANLGLAIGAQDLAYFLDGYGMFESNSMYLSIIMMIKMTIYLFMIVFVIVRKLSRRLPASNYVYMLVLLLAIWLPDNS